jgi:hypothetical protein
MHIRMRLLTVIFCLTALAGRLEAQDASESSNLRPTAPYLAPVPGNLHWVVTFTYPQKTPDGPPVPPPPGTYPVRVETIKVGNLRHITVTLVNGTSQQFDIFGSNCFAQTSEGLELFSLGENYQPFMFYEPGFSFTQCVNLASFKETTTYQGVPAFHYQNDSMEAWISVSTTLPIGARIVGYVKTSYQYLPTPNPGDVALTADEQKILERRKLGAEVYKNMR